MSPKKNQDAKAATGAKAACGTVATRADGAELTAATTLSVEHAGRRYEALAWGPESGQKVLALHGWLDNAASFAVLAPLLPDFRIIAVDLPGHGHSPHRSDRGYHIVDYVFDVMHMADGLGWQKFDLLGHSLGAGIATLVAGAFAERIRRLALIEGLGPLTAQPENMPAALKQAWLKSAAMLQKAPPSYDNFEDAVRARARGGKRGGGKLPEEAARMLCQRGLQRREGRWYWRNDAHLTLPSTQRMTESQVVAFLRAIAAPVLVVRAQQGLAFDEQTMQARTKAIADLTLKRIDGGHHLHMEANAHEVARAVRTHLR